MSLVPFFAIDPARAREDLVTVPATVDGASRRSLAVDGYCPNPTCKCTTIELRLGDVTDLFARNPRPALEDLMDVASDIWWGPTPHVEFLVDPKKKTLLADSPRATSASRALIEALKAALGYGYVFWLRLHRECAVAWRKKSLWGSMDRDDIDPGRPLRWIEVFPATPQTAVRFRSTMYAPRRRILRESVVPLPAYPGRGDRGDGEQGIAPGLPERPPSPARGNDRSDRRATGPDAGDLRRGLPHPPESPRATGEPLADHARLRPLAPIGEARRAKRAGVASEPGRAAAHAPPRGPPGTRTARAGHLSRHPRRREAAASYASRGLAPPQCTLPVRERSQVQALL